MSCPKCHGFLVPDDGWIVVEVQPIVRCVNCGLRIIDGMPVQFPPFQANGENGTPKLVVLKRPALTPKQEAWRAYMKDYMRAYRARKRHHTVPNMMSHVL